MKLRDGEGGRHLDAWRDGIGRLHLDGQDFGEATSAVSSRGEYEWFETIAADDVRRLLDLLAASVDDDILEVLEEHWRGERAAELEARLRNSAIPVKRHVI